MPGWQAIAAMSMGAAAQTTPVPDAGQSRAMTEAIANKARAKTSAARQSGPEPAMPDAAKAAGAHGRVFVELIVDVRGKPAEVSVVGSSRSPELDKAALKAVKASLFEPARDANGVPIPVYMQIPIGFSNARSPGKGGGILRYSCRQFVRDENWWAATWPQYKSDIYTMALGRVLSATPGAMSNGDSMGATITAFKQSWAKARADCAATPDKLFVDILEPGGKLLRRQAEPVAPGPYEIDDSAITGRRPH